MSLQALSEYTRIAKYSLFVPELSRRETWKEQISDRVTQMHRTKYAHLLDAIGPYIEFIEEKMLEKAVLGSQRILQFGGKPVLKHNLRAYNCFRKNTKFITSEGLKSFNDFQENQNITVLTHTGEWKNAIVKSYGIQKFNKIRVARGAQSVEYYVTPNHRWLLDDLNSTITETTNLKAKDRLLAGPNIFHLFSWEEASWDEKLYWCYGMVYGDGTKVKKNGIYTGSMIRLCGLDKNFASRFEEMGFSTSSSLSCKGDFIAYTGSYLKSAPNPKVDSPELIRAFVAGYLQADGAKNHNSDIRQYKSIQSSEKDHIDFIRLCFPIAGVYITSEKEYTGQVTNFGVRPYTIEFKINDHFSISSASQFMVQEIIETDIAETAWCLEVDDNRSFVLEGGISTGNCCFTYIDRPRVFQEIMYALLCGSGVGFSVQKHHVAKLNPIKQPSEQTVIFQIPDTIEGWSDAVGVLVSSHMTGNVPFPEYQNKTVKFDSSLIREEGAPLSTGHKAPGPAGLVKALEKIRAILAQCADGDYLRPIQAYDIIMHAADAVISGGVRRSATIAMFSRDDEEMLTAKTGNWFIDNPQRGRSNNSAVLLRNQVTAEEFAAVIKHTKEFGEPGFIWVNSLEEGFNPCVEASLTAWHKITKESGFSMCNLTEINGSLCKTREAFLEACKAAAIIGTLQAGYTDFPYLGRVTEEIVKQDALLGVSITGIMDSPDILLNPAILKEGAELVKATNIEVAAILGINPAARCTVIKPSGTASCILKTGSGIHPHHARRYFRRVQANRQETPLQFMESINPRAVEESVWDPNGVTKVITFLCEVPPGAKLKNQLSAIALLENVKLVQENWVIPGTNLDVATDPNTRHNVSNTINVQEDEWPQVAEFIYENRKFFTGVSLLSSSGDKDYYQAPFCTVPFPQEMVKLYGSGALFGSGLIVDALNIWPNLWDACTVAMGYSKPENDEQTIWCNRINEFARRYFQGDIRKATYCLKDIHNIKLWEDLSREYVEPDFSQMIEHTDEVNFQGEAACAGGSCEINWS